MDFDKLIIDRSKIIDYEMSFGAGGSAEINLRVGSGGTELLFNADWGHAEKSRISIRKTIANKIKVVV